MGSCPNRGGLLDHFAALADPRRAWKVVYPLQETPLIGLCGTMAREEDFVEIRRWGSVHLAFLCRFLPFGDGPPARRNCQLFRIRRRDG